MKKIYEKIFSVGFFKRFLSVPVIGKLLTYEILSYLFFGVMTTVVNLTVFFVSDKILGNGSLAEFSAFGHLFRITFEDISTLIAWIVAVLFAYVTNKLWVFESKNTAPAVIIREIVSFFGARIVSFAVFESFGFMVVRNIFINLGLFASENASKWIAKILLSVIVVVFNYVMSKLVIFRKKKDTSEGDK
ncbi:MAG: GtrA family protein [Clostridia bacterium]|nr:GtrA family protein [Clostridia bacterium]